jgi:hypothetical protein
VRHGRALNAAVVLGFFEEPPEAIGVAQSESETAAVASEQTVRASRMTVNVCQQQLREVTNLTS